MKELRLREYEEVVLLLVGILGEEAYAFRIAEDYYEQTQRTTTIGAVHSTLSRMEKKGLLTSEMSAPAAYRGGRRKRIYRITAYGVRLLEQARALRLHLWNQYPGFAGNAFLHG